MGMPADIAAPAATGESAATAVQASERIQSPSVRLSIGTFSTVHPISAPPVRANAATNSHERAGSGTLDQRPDTPAAANTSAASAIPPNAWKSHREWLETAPPKPNFAAREYALKSPQWPPTAPSS